jgi:hypothetical protein
MKNLFLGFIRSYPQLSVAKFVLCFWNLLLWKENRNAVNRAGNEVKHNVRI